MSRISARWSWKLQKKRVGVKGTAPAPGLISAFRLAANGRSPPASSNGFSRKMNASLIDGAIISDLCFCIVSALSCPVRCCHNVPYRPLPPKACGNGKASRPDKGHYEACKGPASARACTKFIAISTGCAACQRHDGPSARRNSILS